MDIVNRLRRYAGDVCISTPTEVEAADEIERLRAECKAHAAMALNGIEYKHTVSRLEQIFHDERFAGSKDWRDSGVVGRAEWLAEMYEQLRIERNEARLEERQAMAYLSALRKIVGGDTYPDMIERVRKLAATVPSRDEELLRQCLKALYACDDGNWVELVHVLQERLK